jgi:hypothetical protein
MDGSHSKGGRNALTLDLRLEEVLQIRADSSLRSGSDRLFAIIAFWSNLLDYRWTECGLGRRPNKDLGHAPKRPYSVEPQPGKLPCTTNHTTTVTGDLLQKPMLSESPYAEQTSTKAGM